MAKILHELVDERQRQLARTDLAHSCCVEAAAGTGKTSLLVDRLLTIVCEEGTALDKVVAITFTRKAAAELKVRLREELEKRKGGAPEPVIFWIERALEQLDQARISTIHAYAASLLRERPVEAQIDPGFEELDEIGSQLLFDEVWQQWKERQMQEAPPILQRLLNLEFSLDHTIKDIAHALFNNRDLMDEQTPPPSPIHEIWGEIESKVQELDQIAKYCIREDDRGYQQIQRLKADIARTSSDELDREHAILIDIKVTPSLGAQPKWNPPTACAQQKRICEELQSILKQAPARLGPSLITSMLQWLGGFLRELDRVKNSRGQVDFQDLLLKARNLVRNNKEVRAYFQRSIRHLLVDEFQDTNPLQAELVFFLAERSPKADCWEQVEIQPGKLFLVGDPKQSIYKFRRADIQIYQRAIQMVTRGKKPLLIQQNFRSSPSVLKAVNAIFESQMTAGEYQAEYVPLFPAPERSDVAPGVVVLFPPKDYAPGTMATYRAAEAGLISRFIRQLTDGAGPIQAWDKERRQERRIGYRDIAVLFPVGSGLEFYEDALRAAGIPFQLEAGKQFYARRETRALIALLSAVDNPEDPVAVTAALRSPLLGMSDADLFLHKNTNGSFHYLRSRGGTERVREAYEQLRRWHEFRGAVPLGTLVQRILDETCALQFFLLVRDGEQAVANLLRVAELARNFEAQPGASLRSFVGWLRQRQDAELAEAGSALRNESENAVQMMTIHAAKGLEFPVVILANMASERGRTQTFCVNHNKREIGLSLGEHKMTSANFEAMTESERVRDQAEDLRLFYVAATRARDCLVLPHIAPEQTKNARFLDFYGGWMASLGNRPKETTCADGVMLVPAESLPQTGEPAPALRKNIGTLPLDEDAAGHILREREAWKNELKGLGLEPARPAEPESMDSAAKAMGRVFHRVMQQVDLNGRSALDALLARETAGERLEDPSELKAWVTSTLANPVMARARRSKRVWRELPFCVMREGVPVEGSIDLLFEEEGGLVIVDYKTDAEVLAERHREQLEFYAAALEEITGAKAKEAIVFFVRFGIAERLA